MNIGVDYDDVVNTWMNSFLRWHNHVYGSDFSLRHVSPHSSFYRSMGLDDSEGLKRIQMFTSSEHHDAMIPEVGVEIVVPIMAQSHNFVLITARPESHAPLLKDWLSRRNLGEYFSEHVFTGQWGDSRAPLTKSQVCQRLGLALMIDDSPAHLTDCSQAGIDVIPYNKPWNNFIFLPKRANQLPTSYSWFDIERIVETYK